MPIRDPGPTAPEAISADGEPRSSTRAEARDAAAGSSAIGPGELVGRYTVQGELGRGGMGVVLRAHDPRANRTVALKLLHSNTSDRHARRLEREAQAMARLDHPNVVHVFEVGQARGHRYIAMELVEGVTVQAWMNRRPRPSWQDCVEVFLQAGEGLAAAHAAGLVHRDFKPANCIIDDEGRVRVLDFGLVHDSGPSLDGERPTDSRPQLDPSDEVLTRTGTVLGTVAYMAPEQLDGRATDPRSDQFSFCVALYEALYAERPFRGKTVAQLSIALHRGEIRAPPEGHRVPRRVRRVILRGLRRLPEERWPSMAVLLERLRSSAAPRRRGRWAAMAVAGAMAGAWLLWPKPTVTSCEDARAQLEGVWDDARRQTLRDAILDTELSYAPATWERVERGLDAHATAWREGYADACRGSEAESAQPNDLLDLRMRCLRQRRDELREAVGVLAEADETRVQHAVELIADLPSPTRCDDVEHLRAEVPPPTDPEVAAEVESIRQAMAGAQSLAHAGEVERAMAAADEVAERALSVAYPPLHAEALYQRGLLRSILGHYPQAEADLERAYLLAVEHGHERYAVEAVTRLANVVGHLQAEHERGLWWSRTGLARQERNPIDPSMKADLLAITGSILGDQGKPEEALEHHRRALDLWKEHGSSLDLARSLGDIGAVLDQQGKLDESIDHYRRALAVLDEALGPRHPQVAVVLNNLGAVLADGGEDEEALECYRRALEIWQDAYGHQHPYVGSSLANIGNQLFFHGELEDALAHLEQAREIWEASLGPRHPQVGQLRVNIGNVLRAQGRYEAALEHLRTGRAILEERLGPRHPALALVLTNLGATAEILGHLDEAEAYHEQALSLWEEAHGPQYPMLAMALGGLAEVALAKGDTTAARARAERALELLSTEGASAHPLLRAEIDFLMARALWPEPDRRAHALALARAALARFEEAGQTANTTRAREWLDEIGVDER